jgi:Ca2+-binding EF-hand superfamily protein
MATDAELNEWFQAFDADGSGKIEAGELRNVVKAFYEWQKIEADDAKIDADVGAILKDVDTSGDGKIDKKEFFAYFKV